MSMQPSRLLAQCPLCQTSYDEKEIRLVGEKGTTRMFHCTCQSCGHAMLAVILEASGFVSSVGVMTDLEANDALRFQQATSISSDECVHLHTVLEQESRKFCQALLKTK